MVALVSHAGAVALGDPPDFGPGGAWPSLESDPIQIGAAAFCTSSRPEQDTVEFERTFARSTKMTKFLSHPILSHPTWGFSIHESFVLLVLYLEWKLKRKAFELREIQIQHFLVWQEKTRSWNSRRERASEVTHTTTVGVTETQTRELAASLGLKTGKMASLNAELSGKFAIQTSLTEQRSVSDVLAFRNDGPRSYRLYTLWSVRHDIYVKRLEVPMAEIPDSLKSGEGVEERPVRLAGVEE